MSNNLYQQYLNNNHITRYRIAKISNIRESTLHSAAYSKGGTDTISGKLLKATGKALGKEPWIVFKELLELEQQNTHQ